jgi:hypothetical protein
VVGIACVPGPGFGWKLGGGAASVFGCGDGAISGAVATDAGLGGTAPLGCSTGTMFVLGWSTGTMFFDPTDGPLLRPAAFGLSGGMLATPFRGPVMGLKGRATIDFGGARGFIDLGGFAGLSSFPDLTGFADLVGLIDFAFTDFVDAGFTDFAKLSDTAASNEKASAVPSDSSAIRLVLRNMTLARGWKVNLLLSLFRALVVLYRTPVQPVLLASATGCGKPTRGRALSA